MWHATEALLWSTCSKLLRRSQPLNLLTLEKHLANSLGLNIDDFNQRIKVHEHLGNLVLQFLQQHHQTLMPHSPDFETLQKHHNLKRAHELLQAQYSASQRSSPPSTITAQKDDAELVTPPPVNHSQSSTLTGSLPTVSAAALGGKSFDVPPQQQLRSIQSLHGLSPPPAKPRCTARPERPAISRDSTSSRLPLLLPCRRCSSGPTAPPVSTATSLWIPWQFSSCKRVNVCQASLWGTRARLHHQALGQSAVPAHCGSSTSYRMK